jgi:hypothetical protein
MGKGAQQFYPILQPEAAHLGFQRRSQRAVSDNLHAETTAAMPKNVSRSDEVVQALLLGQPGHRQNHRGL